MFCGSRIIIDSMQLTVSERERGGGGGREGRRERRRMGENYVAIDIVYFEL